ncbi:malto-oligosyltrehalose trehalohydrolase [Pararhizobium arenae]|uniref:malto-oligosyltrehalose trehalohydrolase n=1 Tax=Pararhizobium arenae TaxID=1856850 RepID=UPI00094B02F5|nr:malto-oligosyltrehalose trehalohydrolase [Pararhizobium arenae]
MNADISAFPPIPQNSTEQQWGPVRLSDGRFRFQLWAPAEDEIRLMLDGTDLAMMKTDDGWHRVESKADYGAVYGFMLPDGKVVADPASRFQLEALDGPSLLVDPAGYTWLDHDWRGRPWEEAVIYEIHVGTFTEEGTFRAAISKLKRLADLGITAVELMPLAHFPGSRGWGYDGVLQFALHNAYGTPDNLRAFVDAAHALGLMVFLDVVYNHFGPEGNYLGRYAPGFFRTDVDTPWGAAIAYEKAEVRAYFVENVLYWLNEFHLDGLRFDAIDQILDGSDTHILEQIAQSVRTSIIDRHVHLITENPANGTDLMAERPGGRLYKADWNDDFHHAMHVAVTGEGGGCFEPFEDDPWHKLRHVLAHGYLKPGKAIVSDDPPPSESLPPTAFIHFLQNHDQIGNRALGDRLHLGLDRHLYRSLTAILLLSPQIPLLYMGDEHLSLRPFHFFADYDGEIAKAVRKNRPKEAANFGGIPEGYGEEDIPDPNQYQTFLESKLDWSEADTLGGGAWAQLIHELISIRRETIIPLLSNAAGYAGTIIDAPDKCVFIDWKLGESILQLRSNLSTEDAALPVGLGDRIYPQSDVEEGALRAATVQVFVR